ncbi:hypothetical protein A2774_00895 [Candidatus Roizmanbacteria bacterium RIFCSPHIGHO2_01_FULL_39_12c]|uniref:Uncharacterized protein n=1 Tax=Candidatus Roizmanbacteria bacterium RIFCSPHIGHO2_01_FULL_39_12c TaxID=1802031 RepID=A0A1F7GF52_9BACT|nr:MAG: hypothetical protein A2774_00895 [Candidatus Roizmanbacteria bacterium RIFCSPHIGHO2_01_FULL_39_12c]OGK46548.1 MAG: hypothetical protein A2963_02310 [Candidatus Roizmanbacteria bacterium RIFCSPLOWO2_01_FULL_40_13]
MNTGLPGTGIGGLFYMFSVAVMIFIEVKDLLLRKKNNKRKKIVIEQSIIIVLLISAIYATNVFFSKYVFKKPPVLLAVNATFEEKSRFIILNYPIIVPLLLLFVVLIFTQIMYFHFRTSNK